MLKTSNPEDPYFEARQKMVQTQLAARDIREQRILDAFLKVERHHFMGVKDKNIAYGDHPYRIGHGQTISQPYMVAAMTQFLEVERGDDLLEVGTGCGYQTAIFLEMGARVYGIERIPELVQLGHRNLKSAGYENFDIIQANAYDHQHQNAPFNKILVAACSPHMVDNLVEQLAPGGKMLIPVGGFWQELVLLEKGKDGIKSRDLMPVRFVPLVKE